jgi:hypothetical protein
MDCTDRDVLEWGKPVCDGIRGLIDEWISEQQRAAREANDIRRRTANIELDKTYREQYANRSWTLRTEIIRRIPGGDPNPMAAESYAAALSVHPSIVSNLLGIEDVLSDLNDLSNRLEQKH